MKRIIGVIGYSDDKCKTDYARKLVKEAIVETMTALGWKPDLPLNKTPFTFSICSGLTNLGIPALAYEFAKKYEFQTIGVACAKATEYECYPVDKEVIVGTEWGDESEEFLSQIDALVRIGGGPQSEREAEAWVGNGPYIYKPLTLEGKQ